MAKAASARNRRRKSSRIFCRRSESVGRRYGSQKRGSFPARFAMKQDNEAALWKAVRDGKAARVTAVLGSLEASRNRRLHEKAIPSHLTGIMRRLVPERTAGKMPA